MGANVAGFIWRLKAMDQATKVLRKVKDQIETVNKANTKSAKEAVKAGKLQQDVLKKIALASKVYLGAAAVAWLAYDNIISNVTTGLAGMTGSMRRQFDTQLRLLTTHTMLSARQIGALQESMKDVGFGAEQIKAFSPTLARGASVLGVRNAGLAARTAIRGTGTVGHDPEEQAKAIRRVMDTIAAAKQSGDEFTRGMAVAAQQALETGDLEKFRMQFSQLEATVTDVDGTLEELNRKRMAEYSGTWKEAKDSTLQAAGAIGKVLAPAIIFVIKPIAKMMQLVAKYPLLSSLATGIIIAAAAVGTITAAVIGWTIAQTALNIALAPVVIPIIAITAGVGALVGVIIWVTKKWKDWGTVTKTVIAIFVPLILIIQLVRKAWQAWGDDIKAFARKWGWLFSPITITIKLVQKLIDRFDALKRAREAVIGGGKAVGGAIKGGLEKTGKFLGFAKGGFVERSGLAQIHSGEAIVPHAKVRPLSSGPTGGGITVTFTGPINARTEDEARSSAEFFARAFVTSLQANGGT